MRIHIVLTAVTLIAVLFFAAGMVSNQPAAPDKTHSQERILLYWLFTGRDIRQQPETARTSRVKEPVAARQPEDIVAVAKQYLGTPYRYGGSSPDGFDCSGYIMHLFGKFGKELPRTADQQATVGRLVDFNSLQPGDMVFFTTDEPVISHSGLYIGDRRFIHASSNAKEVIISSIDDPYWQAAFRIGRRLMIK